ncbi:hydroxymethylglutaryl-coenzyme A reductase domain protein [Trichinella spiralis]|uniref:hydroxymethylglutaryl-coenzyme A reductase domain protein n=1 Tax=Trichinella spiralis TaxID=6334 RepID=UPI0001EFBA2E|nr:hydroxymethylglutaryl-coenzyme A reductase domain protein [Trichinella spiralis]
MNKLHRNSAKDVVKRSQSEIEIIGESLINLAMRQTCIWQQINITQIKTFNTINTFAFGKVQQLLSATVNDNCVFAGLMKSRKNALLQSDKQLFLFSTGKFKCFLMCVSMDYYFDSATILCLSVLAVSEVLWLFKSSNTANKRFEVTFYALLTICCIICLKFGILSRTQMLWTLVTMPSRASMSTTNLTKLEISQLLSDVFPFLPNFISGFLVLCGIADFKNAAVYVISTASTHVALFLSLLIVCKFSQSYSKSKKLFNKVRRKTSVMPYFSVVIIFVAVLLRFVDKSYLTEEFINITNTASFSFVTLWFAYFQLLKRIICPPTGYRHPMDSCVQPMTKSVQTISEKETIHKGEQIERKNAAVEAYLDCSTPLHSTFVLTKPVRSVEDLCELLNHKDQVKTMSDEEVLLLLKKGKMQSYSLESLLEESRAVYIRRLWFSDLCSKNQSVDCIPHQNYDYSLSSNACCENTLGYIPVPVGFAGPLKVDDRTVYIPLSTTEGCLVASLNRGCRALQLSAGVRTVLLGDRMTRGPVVCFEDIVQAHEFKLWIENEDNYLLLKNIFNSTSRYAKLTAIDVALSGRFVYLRFSATTGDAMGMNMISKGVELVLSELQHNYFPNMKIISLSGNYCVDKKASAMNWIVGRGKSVSCEAVVRRSVVTDILKTDVDSLVELNTLKNLVGSARAGVLGGFNAHSANIVAAIFLSTGQDIAEVVGSSQCLTFLEKTENGDLRISCTMPTLEVGTVGGGTVLPAQKACLEILGCAGSCDEFPGNNARRFSRIICAAVLAGELSLLSALCAGHLVRSHMRYNRSNLKLKSATVEDSFLEQFTTLTNRALKPKNIAPQSCSTVFM